MSEDLIRLVRRGVVHNPNGVMVACSVKGMRPAHDLLAEARDLGAV